MASFAMHYIIGEHFLKGISNNINEDDKNRFRLGNLVVDSIKIDNYNREEKLRIKFITHFRDACDNDKCIQIPNVDKFYNKYKNLVQNDYSALGYLFHLYTDKLFFEYLYTDVVEVLDSERNKTNYSDKACYVKVLKNNKLYKVNDFYSGSDEGGLYRDYSNMNKYLIDKYNISFDYDKLREISKNKFNNPGIEEIDYKGVGKIIDKMKRIIEKSVLGNELNVFDINDIDNFIVRVNDEFIKKYRDSIDMLIKDR